MFACADNATPLDFLSALLASLITAGLTCGDRGSLGSGRASEGWTYMYMYWYNTIVRLYLGWCSLTIRAGRSTNGQAMPYYTLSMFPCGHLPVHN